MEEVGSALRAAEEPLPAGGWRRLERELKAPVVPLRRPGRLLDRLSGWRAAAAAAVLLAGMWSAGELLLRPTPEWPSGGEIAALTTEEQASSAPSRPEPVRPEAVRPESVRPEAVRPEAVRPEPARSKAAHPAADYSEPVYSEPVYSEPLRSEPGRHFGAAAASGNDRPETSAEAAGTAERDDMAEYVAAAEPDDMAEYSAAAKRNDMAEYDVAAEQGDAVKKRSAAEPAGLPQPSAAYRAERRTASAAEDPFTVRKLAGKRSGGGIALSVAGGFALSDRRSGGTMLLPAFNAVSEEAGELAGKTVYLDGQLFVDTSTADWSYNHRVPLSFGLSAGWEVAHGVTLSSGLTYTLLRSEVTVVGGRDPLSQRLHFLGIPLRVEWHFLRRSDFALYVGAGAMAEKCVGGRLGDAEVRIRPVQWSVDGTVGAQYALGEHLALYFEPDLSCYLTRSDLRTVRTDSPVTLSLRLGVKLLY